MGSSIHVTLAVVRAQVVTPPSARRRARRPFGAAASGRAYNKSPKRINMQSVWLWKLNSRK